MLNLPFILHAVSLSRFIAGSIFKTTGARIKLTEAVEEFKKTSPTKVYLTFDSEIKDFQRKDISDLNIFRLFVKIVGKLTLIQLPPLWFFNRLTDDFCK